MLLTVIFLLFVCLIIIGILILDHIHKKGSFIEYFLLDILTISVFFLLLQQLWNILN